MIDTDALWQAAREHWPEIDESKTLLTFVKMLLVESLVLKEKKPDDETLWTGAMLGVAELLDMDTGLSFDERIELHLASSPFEMERIALEPVGEFMMGYGPRADLLAVQEVQI